jgi:hypothetical protein
MCLDLFCTLLELCSEIFFVANSFVSTFTHKKLKLSFYNLKKLQGILLEQFYLIFSLTLEQIKNKIPRVNSPKTFLMVLINF